MQMNQQSSAKLDRKTIEKNRRIQMKALYSKLESLLPSSSNRRDGVARLVPLPDRIEEAVNYIKWLQERIEILKKERMLLMGIAVGSSSVGLKSVKMEVRDLVVPGLKEVAVVTRGNCGDHDANIFFEVMRVLEQEGAEIISANYVVTGHDAFQTIHTKVSENKASGFECEKVLQKLKQAINVDQANVTQVDKI